VEGSADELNRLDGYAGDGDLGITMTAAAHALQDVLATAGEMSTTQLLSACGSALARKAPSTSGTLVATGFLRAAKVADDGSGPAVVVLERCFSAASEGVQARGKAAVGDRTLVDGLDAVCSSLRRSVASGSDISHALADAAQAATAVAEATVAMVPKVGRSSWVPERAAGHPDAGCAMLAIVVRAVAASVAAG
jgi:dihydroxyacetone kinase-like protein